MSDFGMFEAAVDAEQAPRRREMIAARKMSAALQEVHRTFEAWVTNAPTADDFEDRWGGSRKAIASTMIAHGVGAYPAVMREVHGSLKSAWYAKHAGDDDDPTVEPKSDKDRDRTITDKQKEGIDEGNREKAEDVDTNSGDGSDASGNKKDARRRRANEGPFEEEAGDTEDSNFTSGDDTGTDKTGRRRVAGDGPFDDDHNLRHAPEQHLQEGRPHSDGLLIPTDHNDPSNPETSGVQNNFSSGGDTGVDSHHREAAQLIADLYTDWAQGNGLRVASMNTLDVYAANGLHDDDYFLLASLIRKADEDCPCDDDEDTDGPEGPDKDDDGPPSGGSDDSGSDESSDGEGDSSSSEGGSDSDGDSSDSGSDESSSGDNPFASGGDEGAPDDAGDSSGGENPFGGGDTAIDDSEGTDEQVPPGGPEGPPAGPPGAEAGPPADPSADVGGQSFEVPQEAPPLPPEMQQQIPQNDTAGDQPIPPEVIDQILGLPPGTLEQLVMEELNGGGGAPPSGPPPHVGSRQRRAAEDPTEAAGSDPAAAAQPQTPAAPPAGAGSAGTMPPPGSASVAPPPPAMPLENQPAEDALLDTALQSVTQMIDTETQEYQQIIDPLTNALQAIQFAQQVEQAENPLDVTPPEGTTDVTPAAAPGGANSLQQQASRIASRYKLTQRGYNMLLEAMSRKHYEHVGEAIRTLPPEMRGGIANHIGAMFREDNPRFNNDKWLESVGAANVVASRRPFVIRSRKANGGRTAGENLVNTPTLDAFEFPGHGEQKAVPQISDNIAINELPKMKGAALREAKDVLKKWDDWSKIQTDKGLNVGGDAEVDQFVTEKGIGPKATDKLKKTIAHNRRSASFFTRRVPGWTWDDHLAGYISKEARPFECSCGNTIPTPSYGTCRCGKLWNSYAIGDGNHLAANTADMFITREIPVRDDVIVANRKMIADSGVSDYNNSVLGQQPSGGGVVDPTGGLLGETAMPGVNPLYDGAGTGGEGLMKGQSGVTPLGGGNLGDAADAIRPDGGGFLQPAASRRKSADDRGYESYDPYGKDDTDWYTDAERGNIPDANAPHAPGETADDGHHHGRKTACWPGCHEDKEHSEKFHNKDDKKEAARAAIAGLIGEPVGHVSDPSFQGVVRSVDPMKGTAWVSHPGGIHEMSIYDLHSSGTPPAGPSLKQRVRQHLLDRQNRGGPPGGFAGGRSASQDFFADKVTDTNDSWVKYDDEDPARQGGPKKPPSTKIKGGDPKWHQREPAGQFKSTNPFGG